MTTFLIFGRRDKFNIGRIRLWRRWFARSPGAIYYTSVPRARARRAGRRRLMSFATDDGPGRDATATAADRRVAVAMTGTVPAGGPPTRLRRRSGGRATVTAA